MNRNLLIITVGRVAQMLIMFATYRVLSTVLSVSDMGGYYFLLSISAGFGLLFANPIGMYLNRMIHAWKEEGTAIRNIVVVIMAFLIGSLLTIPFLFLFQERLAVDSHQLNFIIFILILYVFSNSINGTLVPSLNILGYSGHFVIWTLLSSIVGLILSYGLVASIKPDPYLWLLGQGIALTFFGLISFVILNRKLDKKVVKISHNKLIKLRKIGSFALPIVFTNIAVWSLGQSFRFFFKEKIDPISLGELTFGLGMATSLSVAVEYLFQQLYLPEFYSKLDQKGIDRGTIWNRFFNKLVPSYIAVAFYLFGLAPFILRVLADPKFKGAYTFLAIGAFVEFFRMLANIFNMATQSELKTHKALGPYLLGGGLTLVGVLWISHHQELLKFTPFILILGYVASLLYLILNVKKMFPIVVDYLLILKVSMMSCLFLLARYLIDFSEGLIFSVIINISFGLVLVLILYKLYQKGIREESK